MKKVFVTGGTGFIGQSVVRKLIERGDDVYALVRSEKGSAALQAMGAKPVKGDICNIESMRDGMRGSEVVFHIAGWYKIGSTDRQAAEAINVEGTRNVLQLAVDLGVPRIVYTSTVAVFGDTRGELCDETCHPKAGPFLTEYDRTKWRAHVEVAQPMIEAGAPVIIVMPGAVYGPGDPSLVGKYMRAYSLGLLPVLPGPELTLTYAHVDDIAEGHLLAADQGKPGESYILAGPASTMREMVKIWSEVTGKSAPLFSIPARFIKPFTPLVERLGSILPLPELISRDTMSIVDATYLGRSDKAREQLGWQTRPLREGMRETFYWIARDSVAEADFIARQKQNVGLALGATLGVLLFMFVNRKKD